MWEALHDAFSSVGLLWDLLAGGRGTGRVLRACVQLEQSRCSEDRLSFLLALKLEGED